MKNNNKLKLLKLLADNGHFIAAALVVDHFFAAGHISENHC